MVLNTITFVFIFSCAVQGQSDLDLEFPYTDTVPKQDGVLSSMPPSKSSCFCNYISSSTRSPSPYSRYWISSTSLPLQSSNNNQISSSKTPSYDQDLIPQPERKPSLQSFDSKERIPRLYPSLIDNYRSISPSSKHDQALIPSTERQSSLSFNSKGRISSTPDYELNISPTSRSSHGIRLSYSRRGSEDNKSPMILFDEHGDMHTNYYPDPHAAYRGNKNNKNTGDSEMGGRRHWPNWSAVTN